MKSLVRALPAIAGHFDQIEIWAVECDVVHPKVNWQKIWAPRFWPARLVWCVLYFHLRAFWRYQVLRQMKPEIIQCTDFYALFADIIYVHFHFARYCQILAEKSAEISLSLPKKSFVMVCWLLEKLCFRFARPKKWLTVSKSMAKRLGEEEHKKSVSILPNAYDPTRFYPGLRQECYDMVRAELGICPNELVFGFSALGDFKRKGFPLLLSAAKLLEQAGHSTKILIVGPELEAIADAVQLNDYGYPREKVIATGRVSNTERYFSAMDAFVFPSHCESFCLVLMEAAAMGIPIFPAAFDGHEMTLVEGKNGARIPWDANGICCTLLEYLPMIREKIRPSLLAHAVSDAQFQEQLLTIYQNLLAKSDAPHHA